MDYRVIISTKPPDDKKTAQNAQNLQKKCIYMYIKKKISKLPEKLSIIDIYEKFDNLYTDRYNKPEIRDKTMNNKLKILNSALDLIALKGYDAVGVKEITDNAGITKPTLYHYFGNKQGLLDELLKEYYSKLINAITQTSSYNGDLPLTLNKTVKAYFDFATNNSTFYRLLLSIKFAPPQSEVYQTVSKYDNQLSQIILDLFKHASNQHGNMRGKEEIFAATFQGMINNYIGMSLNNAIILDDTLIYQAIHQFQHGIYS
ncbi:MAG: TetR/AcrR family transcriptional regulator [Vampirovibrionia bacterium]